MPDPNFPDRDPNKDKDNGGGNDPGGPNRPPHNFVSRSIVGWIMLAGLAVLLLYLMNSNQYQAREVNQPEFMEWAKQHAFKDEVVIKDDMITGELKEDTAGVPSDWQKPYNVMAKISTDTKSDVRAELKESGQAFSEEPGSPILLHLLISWGPILLIGFLIYFFVFRSLRGAGGGPGGMLGNFGRSRHKVLSKEHSTVTLGDVAGINEAKDEVNEIIEFLKNPKKFQRLGGRVPRGVLLIGEPGCGKTLLAKAVAGEAEVPFFSISGSDFVEMFVGVGASRVRDLFKQAKESSPCIIFLDEIDAVGRRRGSGFSSGGHDEREQTLNAILVEMDGFETNDQVIVVAATNRADVLDPALTRPGRFDRQIHVPLPDLRGRLEILRVHSRRVKMGPNVKLDRVARGTPMFSGADLAAIINEAAIGATLQGKDFVEMEDLEEARDKVKWGRARKSHRVEEDEKKVIAYHEAGHAIVMYFDKDSEPLHKVTIIPRGRALGTTFHLPEKDRNLYSKRQLLASMRVSFGGRIAEEMFTGDQYNGTAGDIRQATDIARAMVMEYGMSDRVGFQLVGVDERKNAWEQPDKMYSDETARIIDEEVKRLIDTTYRETKELIEEHRDQLDAMAKALLKYETLDYDDVDRLMKGEPLNKPTVADLLQAEQDKAAEESSAKPETQDGDDAPGIMPTPA